MIPRFKPSLGWSEFSAMFKPNKGKVEKFEKDFAKKFKAVDAVAFPVASVSVPILAASTCQS